MERDEPKPLDIDLPELEGVVRARGRLDKSESEE